MTSTSKAKMCPSCSGIDHQRPSNKLSPNHKPSQKKRFVDSSTKMSTYTIKYSFGTFCTNDDIKRRIEADVIEVLHQDLKNFPKTVKSTFVGFYSHLKVTRKIETESRTKTQDKYIPKDEEYFSQMRPAHWLLYDVSYWNHLIENAAVQHETAMKNCIRSRRAIDKLINKLLPVVVEVRTLLYFNRIRLHRGMAFGHQIPTAEELQKDLESCRNKYKIIEEMKLPPRPSYLPEENIKNRNNRRPRKRGLHRYAVCKTCHIVWNRDVNAGRNMVRVVTQNDLNYRKSTLQTPRVGSPNSVSMDSAEAEKIVIWDS
ncbi:hypothetical protein ABEB36_006057 [Hypothenemus hampei]|uniref:Transposase n=1 Tax=Hypothenemus hampei TaxID=57062 RepID=A0ABD1F0C5_HYPHA